MPHSISSLELIQLRYVHVIESLVSSPGSSQLFNVKVGEIYDIVISERGLGTRIGFYHLLLIPSRL